MNNEFLNKVSNQTHVSKEDIFFLANDLQNKDLNNEADIRSFIKTLTAFTHKQLNEKQIDRLIKMIQEKKIPEEFKKMVE